MERLKREREGETRAMVMERLERKGERVRERDSWRKER